MVYPTLTTSMVAVTFADIEVLHHKICKSRNAICGKQWSFP